MKIPKPLLYLCAGLFVAATIMVYRYREENQELRKKLQAFTSIDSETARTEKDPSKASEAMISGNRADLVKENAMPAETTELTSIHATPPDETLRQFLLGKFKMDGGYLRLNVFDGEGNITEAFAELYGLTDLEIEALAAESARAREQHFQLAKANAEVSTMEDGGTRVVLNPFESDENIYAEVLDSFQRVLGDDRFADFLDLGEAEMRDTFNQFGAERLTVKLVPRTESVEGPDGRLVEVTKYTQVFQKIEM